MNTMLYPTIQEQTNGEYNRYELVIAVAKGTRMVNDENLKRQQSMESFANEEMNVPSKRDPNSSNENIMSTVVKLIKNGEYKITYRTNEEDQIQED